MTKSALGPILYSFFEHHLKAAKGLRPTSIVSYRDSLRLFLTFVTSDAHRRITRLAIEDLTFERVLRFLEHLEHDRGNHIRTRNQRLAALHTFFEYVATLVPEMVAVAERVAAIPTKRAAPPETHYLERDEISSLFSHLPKRGTHALRDRTLLLFLYNTGARVQEVAELRVANLDLGPQPRVNLHGKGDRWRTCPLWKETAEQLRLLLREEGTGNSQESPIFTSRKDRALTRFGIYKIVRRHTSHLQAKGPNARRKRISPHVFRHTTAVHLLESGVEVNVIRGWLGHVSLDTTNRYAEISIQAKEAAVRTFKLSSTISEGFPRRPVWRDDETLLNWLNSL